MTLAWLLLLTGLTISAVAIYYSVVGLAAIFSAAVIPIIVMGSALEVAKLVCASWLKANWSRAPFLLKSYMTIAVAVLMLITSMGIFGFLSKAHSDQSLVSGDVLSKISIYDEKIKTAKDNIDANRKALKQMDEAVDQVMGRSSDEKGADKAVAIRRGQAKERSRLQAEIASEQKLISQLNDEAAPIRAEVRKVEAEVGPIKYIAKFIYGDHGADENMLEKAVTWVIILIVVVFDPLAVIMLLAAQMTFAWHNKNRDPLAEKEEELVHDTVPMYVADVGEKPTAEELAEIEDTNNQPQPFVPDSALWPFPSYREITPKEGSTIDYQVLEDVDEEEAGFDSKPYDSEQEKEELPMPLDQWNKMIEEAEAEAQRELAEREARKYHKPADETPDIERPGDYLTAVTGDRIKPDLTEVIESEDSKKKSYMTKNEQGIQTLKEIK